MSKRFQREMKALEIKFVGKYEFSDKSEQNKVKFGGLDIKVSLTRLAMYGLIGAAGYVGYNEHLRTRAIDSIGDKPHELTLTQRIEIAKKGRDELCLDPKKYIDQATKGYSNLNKKSNELVGTTKPEDWRLACDYIINPLGESTQVLVPYIGILEYAELHQHQDSQNQKKELSLDVNTLIQNEFSNISHIIYIFAKEEIYSENLLIYILALSHRAQHFLFMILVSKARLTTKVNELIKDQLDELDKKLNDVLKKANLPQFSNTATVIDEINRLRNVITQLKLTVQLPMLYAKTGSAHLAYQGLVDFASPRFSNIFLKTPEEFYDNNDFPNVTGYRTIPGEKPVNEVWDQQMLQYAKFNQSNNNLIYSGVNNSLEGSANGCNVSYSQGNRSKIINEGEVSKIEQINGYQEFFGEINFGRLRENYEVLNYLYNIAIKLKNDPKLVDTIVGRNIDKQKEIEKIIARVPVSSDKNINFNHGNTNWTELYSLFLLCGGQNLDEETQLWVLANANLAQELKICMRTFESPVDFRAKSNQITSGLSENKFIRPIEDYRGSITLDEYTTKRESILKGLNEQKTILAVAGIQITDLFEQKNSIGDLGGVVAQIEQIKNTIALSYEIVGDLTWVHLSGDSIITSRPAKIAVGEWINRLKSKSENYELESHWQTNPSLYYSRDSSPLQVYGEQNYRIITAYNNRIQQAIIIHTENSANLGDFSVEAQNLLIDEILGLAVSMNDRLKYIYTFVNFWSNEMEMEFDTRLNIISRIRNPTVRAIALAELFKEVQARLSALKDQIVSMVDGIKFVNDYPTTTSQSWASTTPNVTSSKFLEYLHYIRYQNDLQDITQNLPILKTFSSKAHRNMHKFQWMETILPESEFVRRYSTDEYLDVYAHIEDTIPIDFPLPMMVNQYHRERLVLSKTYTDPNYVNQFPPISIWDRNDRLF